ncbi:MAG: SOS response-associated peptidase [bacterium]|nr:SOS response-associated peptidase [bacterium]
MCYHASVNATYQQLEERYERPFLGNLFPSFTNKTEVVAYHLNGFDFPFMPVITQEQNTVMQCFQWGLIPNWTKNYEQAKTIRIQTLNAKSETVFEKSSFKESIKRQRCLVPLTGFFEWKEMGNKEKQPYFIRLKMQQIFSLAGIYATWQNTEEDRVYNTFSLLTTQANPLMAQIHNTKLRMPVILDQTEEKIWLEPKSTATDLEKCFLPFAEESMEAYSISKLIGSRKQSSNVPEVVLPFKYENLDLFS